MLRKSWIEEPLLGAAYIVGMVGLGVALACCGIPKTTPTPPGQSACPLPIVYSQADLDASAAQLATMRGTVVHRMIDDYEKERAKLAACPR